MKELLQESVNRFPILKSEGPQAVSKSLQPCAVNFQKKYAISTITVLYCESKNTHFCFTCGQPNYGTVHYILVVLRGSFEEDPTSHSR